MFENLWKIVLKKWFVLREWLDFGLTETNVYGDLFQNNKSAFVLTYQ